MSPDFSQNFARPRNDVLGGTFVFRLPYHVGGASLYLFDGQFSQGVVSVLVKKKIRSWKITSRRRQVAAAPQRKQCVR